MDINCSKIDWTRAGGSDHSCLLTWPTSLFSFKVSLCVCVFDNKSQMQIKKLFFKVKTGAHFAAP